MVARRWWLSLRATHFLLLLLLLAAAAVLIISERSKTARANSIALIVDCLTDDTVADNAIDLPGPINDVDDADSFGDPDPDPENASCTNLGDDAGESVCQDAVSQDCPLRMAIWIANTNAVSQAANSDGSPWGGLKGHNATAPHADTIAFAAGLTGRIPLADSLALTDSIGNSGTAIQGSTLGPDRAITLDCDSSDDGLGDVSSALLITSASNVVRNLSVINCTAAAIYLSGEAADGNTIAGNYLGTHPGGGSCTDPAPGVDGDAGNYDGVRIEDGDTNTIGGGTAFDRNVISCNNDDGIDIRGAANANVVRNNWIGSAIYVGPSTLGNSDDGIEDTSSSNTDIIDNVIVSSGVYGLFLDTTGAEVTGNKIGVAADGTTPLGNGNDGIRANLGGSHTIGGSRSGTGCTSPCNIIAFNGDDGVDITDSDSNTVAGNYIGTDTSGTADAGNSEAGVEVFGTASGNTIGGSRPSNQTCAGPCNVIIGNDDDGVEFISSATNNVVAGNNIGIGADGTTPLGNSDDGVEIQSAATGNVVGNNLISGNASYGVYGGTPDNPLDARNNWWGSASGPSTDGAVCNSATGNGDKVSCNVIFSPWLTAPTPGTTPLAVLVHGWGGSCSSMADVKSYLESNGYAGRVVCFDPAGDGKYGYLEKKGVVDSALQLSSTIRAEKGARGMGYSSPNVDIIAHSFGGLVSRYYVEKIAGYVSARKLVMLGTPNNGLTKAALLYLGHRLWPFGDDDLAARDMGIGSAVLGQLNQDFSQPSTGYKVYAGTADTSWVYPGNPDLLANDCLVRTSSASGPGLPTTLVYATHTTGFVKLLCPAHFLITPGLLSSNSPAFPKMLNFLQGGSGAGEESYDVRGVAGTGSEEFEGASVIGSAASIIDPLAVDSTSFGVSAASSASFIVEWEGTETLDFRVRRPGGVLVDPSDSDVEYTDIGEVDESGLSAKQYVISSPAEGTWTTEVDGAGLTAPAAYSVAVLGDSTLGLALEVNSPVVEPAAPVVLAATLADNGVAVTGATVEAQVQSPSNATTLLTLIDDGSGSDALAGDGIYTAAFTATSECGQYFATAIATGLLGPTAFDRESLVIFTSAVAGDAAGDPCVEDDDSDGCTDARELGPNQALGGLRDPLNSWDYFNPSGDRRNRIDDVLLVVQRYAQDAGDPGYDTKYDRTYLGPNRWNLGPPNGQIRVDDILASVYQYAHDCA